MSWEKVLPVPLECKKCRKCWQAEFTFTEIMRPDDPKYICRDCGTSKFTVYGAEEHGER